MIKVRLSLFSLSLSLSLPLSFLSPSLSSSRFLSVFALKLTTDDRSSTTADDDFDDDDLDDLEGDDDDDGTEEGRRRRIAQKKKKKKDGEGVERVSLVHQAFNRAKSSRARAEAEEEAAEAAFLAANGFGQKPQPAKSPAQIEEEEAAEAAEKEERVDMYTALSLVAEHALKDPVRLFALNYCLPSAVRPQMSALKCLPSNVCPQLFALN